jgi:hypothetical protein
MRLIIRMRICLSILFCVSICMFIFPVSTFASGPVITSPMLAAGISNVAGLKSDGTVLFSGVDTANQLVGVSSWSNVTQIAVGWGTIFGVKSDCTVAIVPAPDPFTWLAPISGWNGIVQIAAGFSLPTPEGQGRHVVGLKNDGTVVAVGSFGSYWNENQCAVEGWSNISQIAAGGLHTVGLRSDGTVVAVGNNQYGQCNVSGWSGITQVSAGRYHTVGLKTDGTVAVAGVPPSYHDFGQTNVQTWADIFQISAGGLHTVGLRSDGTVVAVGNNDYSQCEVGSWSGISQVATGYFITSALKSDGTATAIGYRCVASGYTGEYPIDVSNWQLGIDSTNSINTLLDTIQSINLQQGIMNSLDSKLQNARDSLTAANTGQRSDAINKMLAFISACEAQRDKGLTQVQANFLIDKAQMIIALLQP